MTEKPQTGYLLIKRGLYECPNHQGYTGIRDNAGRYSLEVALAHAKHHKEGYIHESEAPEFSKACFHDLALNHVIKQRDALMAESSEFITKEYIIGDLTMKYVFKPNGHTNPSNLQLVFDDVEKALVSLDKCNDTRAEIIASLNGELSVIEAIEAENEKLKSEIKSFILFFRAEAYAELPKNIEDFRAQYLNIWPDIDAEISSASSIPTPSHGDVSPKVTDGASQPATNKGGAA